MSSGRRSPWAQTVDQFKQTRAELDVTLLPLDVDKFMKNVQAEPTEEEKQAFFDKYKDKAADPSAERAACKCRHASRSNI